MESPDNHGYAVNDYKSVQPYYGVIDSRVGFDPDTDVVINDSAGSLAVFDVMRSDLVSVPSESQRNPFLILLSRIKLTRQSIHISLSDYISKP